MDDIELLLKYLSTLFPISNEFREDLRGFLKHRTFHNNKVLIRAGKKAKKAWWLISGYVSASIINDNGKETVVRIYKPEQIFTTFHSFFENVLTTHKLKALTEIRVLEIKKENFLMLQKKYPEAMLMANRIILQNTRSEVERGTLIMLPLKEKVPVFSNHYPISDIPNKACASFLQMSELDYIEQKVILQRSKESRSSGTPAPQLYKNSNEMAHAIKLYLHENYTQSGIDNTTKLAEYFNTTRKTAARNFSKIFGTTVYKFILDLRMDQAKTLLNNNIRNISKIALSVGYKNPFHFSRLFKNYFGHPPNSEPTHHKS